MARATRGVARTAAREPLRAARARRFSKSAASSSSRSRQRSRQSSPMIPPASGSQVPALFERPVAANAPAHRRRYPQKIEQTQRESRKQRARAIRRGDCGQHAGQQRIDVGKRLIRFAERVDHFGNQRKDRKAFRFDQPFPMRGHDLGGNDHVERAPAMHAELDTRFRTQDAPQAGFWRAVCPSRPRRSCRARSKTA